MAEKRQYAKNFTVCMSWQHTLNDTCCISCPENDVSMCMTDGLLYLTHWTHHMLQSHTYTCTAPVSYCVLGCMYSYNPCMCVCVCVSSFCSSESRWGVETKSAVRECWKDGMPDRKKRRRDREGMKGEWNTQLSSTTFHRHPYNTSPSHHSYALNTTQHNRTGLHFITE